MRRKGRKTEREILREQRRAKRKSRSHIRGVMEEVNKGIRQSMK